MRPAPAWPKRRVEAIAADTQAADTQAADTQAADTAAGTAAGAVTAQFVNGCGSAGAHTSLSRLATHPTTQPAPATRYIDVHTHLGRVWNHTVELTRYDDEDDLFRKLGIKVGQS